MSIEFTEQGFKEVFDFTSLNVRCFISKTQKCGRMNSSFIKNIGECKAGFIYEINTSSELFNSLFAFVGNDYVLKESNLPLKTALEEIFGYKDIKFPDSVKVRLTFDL